jgi:hypothetical protein
MKKLNHVHIYLITAIISVIVPGALYVYFISSLSEIKQERMVNIEELKKENQERGSREDTERVRVHAVIDGQEASFVSFVENECVQLGLVCETRSLNKSEANPAIASLQIFSMTVQTNGSFDSITKFLTFLENSSYLIKVISTELSAGEVWSGVFTISVPVVPK